MKKCGLIGVLSLVLVCVFCQSVFAANPVFTAKAQTDESGIIYSVDLSDPSNICALSMSLLYNAEELELDHFDLGDTLSSAIVKTNSELSGKVILTFVTTTPVSDSGELITLYFSPLKNDVQASEIRCEISECLNVDCEAMDFTVYDAGRIQNPLYGKAISENASVDPSGDDRATDDKEDELNVSENAISGNSVDTEEKVSDQSGEQPSNTDLPQADHGEEVTAGASSSTGDYLWILWTTLGLFLIAGMVFIILKYRRKKQ